MIRAFDGEACATALADRYVSTEVERDLKRGDQRAAMQRVSQALRSFGFHQLSRVAMTIVAGPEEEKSGGRGKRQEAAASA